MTTTIVKDYLGHSCKTTEAFEVFSEFVRTAKRDCNGDRRAVARSVGRALLDFKTRIETLNDLMKACKQILPEDDSETLAAVLEAGSAYSLECCNRYVDLAGLVLTALEVGGLFKPQQVDAISKESQAMAA